MSDSIEKDAEIAAHGHMANCHAHDRRPDGTCYCGFDAALSRLVALAREAEGLREEKSAADRNDSFAAEKLRLVLERWGGKPDETVYGLLERLASERDTAIKAKEAAERVIEAECENKYLLVADLEKAEARIEALTTILTKASAMVEDMPELNTNNYDHDQVCDLNARAVELCLFLRTALEGGTAEGVCQKCGGEGDYYVVRCDEDPRKELVPCEACNGERRGEPSQGEGQGV